MALWYWYLIVTVFLSSAGYLTPAPGPLAALALAVHLAFQWFAAKDRAVTGIEAALASIAAAALLWRQSFLPPVSTLVSFLADPRTRPTAGYLLEFAWQVANWRMIAAGAVVLAVASAASRRAPLLFALSVYAALGGSWMLQPKRGVPDFDGDHDFYGEGGAPVATASAPAVGRLAPNIAEADPFYRTRAQVGAPAGGPERGAPPLSPQEFYRQERGKIVIFSPSAKGAPPFDVLILHVCSLSWKDIKDSGADLTPFFSGFDYVFTDFSSACSYSGPAALRVLRSACGQSSHRALYFDARAGCYLMDDLRASGFKTYAMYSHDGKFDDFTAKAERYGHADPPLGVAGLPLAYQMFDGSPMYRDDAALRKVWRARLASGAPRAALYYNTANLHVGTHRPGAPIGPDTAASYRARLDAMVAQLERFFSEVERSGRNAVVIFVPEHGAALSGNKMQAKDVRDIPLPPIATVPVAVKLIGKPSRADALKPTVLTKPASLQAVAWLIAEFMRHDPFGPEARSPDTIASEIPSTAFFAEDENAAVMRLGDGYIYRGKDGDWKPLPDYALIPAGTIPSPADLRRTRARPAFPLAPSRAGTAGLPPR